MLMKDGVELEDWFLLSLHPMNSISDFLSSIVNTEIAIIFLLYYKYESNQVRFNQGDHFYFNIATQINNIVQSI